MHILNENESQAVSGGNIGLALARVLRDFGTAVGFMIDYGTDRDRDPAPAGFGSGLRGRAVEKAYSRWAKKEDNAGDGE